MANEQVSWQDGWTGKWAHLGHRLGECWGNDTQDICYVNIPKCATSYIKGILQGCGGVWYHSEIPLDKSEYLIILRNPIERWCSGIAQYQYNTKKFDMTDQEVFEEITFDDHTELQTYFLQGVDLTRGTFIFMDENFNKNIKEWVKSKSFRTDVDIAKPINISKEDERETIKNKYFDLLEREPKYIETLLEYFKPDYDLINSVEYYGKF